MELDFAAYARIICGAVTKSGDPDLYRPTTLTLGRSAFMKCTTPKELSALEQLLPVDLRETFLIGVMNPAIPARAPVTVKATAGILGDYALARLAGVHIH